jgi:hypothetical protein
MSYKVTSEKHAVLYEVMSAKHACEENGQTGGKNCSSTFVLTAFISFDLFNVFHIMLKGGSCTSGFS